MISDLRHLDFKDWFYGLCNAFIGGGAGAVVTAFAASMISPSTFNLQSGLGDTLELMAATFLINGLLNMFFYLKQSPLPAIVETTTETKTKTTSTTTSTTEPKA